MYKHSQYLIHYVTLDLKYYAPNYVDNHGYTLGYASSSMPTSLTDVYPMMINGPGIHGTRGSAHNSNLVDLIFLYYSISGLCLHKFHCCHINTIVVMWNILQPFLCYNVVEK